MTFTVTLTPLFANLRRRLRPEAGFAMIVALGVLVANLLVAAVYVAVNGDIHQGPARPRLQAGVLRGSCGREHHVMPTSA